MHYLLEKLTEILNHNIMVNVYSSPNFFIEIFISVLMCLVHFILIVDINIAIDEINVPRIKIREKEPVKDVDSSRSIYKGVVRNHPDLGVDVVFKHNTTLLKNDCNTMAKINKILSTSLSEYIRRDLKKMKSKIKIEAGDDVKLITPRTDQSSTDRIYDFLFREPDIQNRFGSRGNEGEEKDIRRLF